MLKKQLPAVYADSTQISENELRMLFHNMISALFYYRVVYDENGQPVDSIILAANETAERVTGLKQKELIGKSLREIYPETEPYWIECYGRVARSGSPEHITQYFGALQKWLSSQVYCIKPDHVVAVLTDVTQNVTEREELKKTAKELAAQREENYQLAHVELISGLPNRICLNEAFAARAKDGDGMFYLAIFGPDNLAELLASYGSVLSDRIMCMVAQRLKAVFDAQDTLFSMTGTDLVLLLPASEDRQEIKEMLLRFLSVIRKPVEDGGTRFYISAKCGVASFPSDGTDRDDVIMKANLALYQAKKIGEPIVFYREQIGQRLLHRTQIRNALPKALANGEFELYYQPQFEIASGRIVGVEALLRWHSPDLGEVPPSEFIGIAEESRMILPLGIWVLETACEAVKRLEQGWNIRLRMAVNVSGLQLSQGGFFEIITSLLQSYDLPPERLELEITESVVLNRENEAIDQLNHLGTNGVRIALDDFGTGYSTMSLLKDLRAATIKIDRTFIQDPNALIMNRVLVRLGHILGAEVVAEGVETQEHMSWVRRIGCDTAQGFLLSVPLPFQELLRVLETNQNSTGGS